MHQNLQQFDLQTLVDLLAVETQKYTKAYISGDSKEAHQQRIIVDFLIEEINIRKQSVVGNANQEQFKNEI